MSETQKLYAVDSHRCSTAHPLMGHWRILKQCHGGELTVQVNYTPVNTVNTTGYTCTLMNVMCTCLSDCKNQYDEHKYNL